MSEKDKVVALKAQNELLKSMSEELEKRAEEIGDLKRQLVGNHLICFSFSLFLHDFLHAF